MSDRSPFVRVPNEHWPEIFELLPKPTPAWARRIDLQWLTYAAPMRLTEREIAARWGLTRGAVRSVKRRSQADPKLIPSRSQDDPRQVGRTPTTAEPRSQDDPKLIPSRSQADPATSKKKEERRKKKEETHVDQAIDLWRNATGKRGPRNGSRVYRALAARLSEDGLEAWQRLVAWYCSNHQRARYLRDNGHGLDTIVRPDNWRKYLDMAGPPERTGAAVAPATADEAYRELDALIEAAKRGEPNGTGWMPDRYWQALPQHGGNPTVRRELVAMRMGGA